ncbi:MAG: hypothetical protein WCX65_11275 [bacterium]
MKKYLCFALLVLIATALFAALARAEDLNKIAVDTRGALELLRGLNFSSNIPVVSVKPEEAKQFGPRIADIYGPNEEELKTLQAEWGFLGLIPEGYDLSGAFREFAAARTRSFYDPAGGRIVFADGAQTPGWSSPLIQKTMETLVVEEPEYLTAHEYAYALLDSNYGLRGVLEGRKRSGDRGRAVLALVNGDASLMTMDYLVRNYGVGVLFLSSPESVIKQFMPVVTYVGKTEMAGVPRIVSDSVAFPLVAGTAFAASLRKTGGFALLNSAYKTPPSSAEQIMHPEKFFEKRDNPVEIAMPDLSEALPVGAKLVSTDALGEWNIREMLSDWLGEAGDGGEAASAADGWGGDRFAIYEKPGGARIGALYTTWDTADDAMVFEGVLKRAARKKYGDKKPVEVQLIGKDVAAVIGAEPDEAAKLAELLWQSEKNPVVSPPPVPEKPSAEDIMSYQSAFINMFANIELEQPEATDYWLVEGDTFTNTKYGYSVTRPNENWQYQRLHLGNQFISEFTALNTKEMGGNFTIFTFNKYAPGGTDNPVDEMVEFMGNQMTGFKKSAGEQCEVGGYQARSVTFSGFAIMPIKIKYTEIFGEKYTYVVTWWGTTANFSKLEPDFQKFMDSFKVVEK